MSLGLTTLLAVGFSAGLFDTPPVRDLSGTPEPARSVSILLSEAVEHRGAAVPIRTHEGPDQSEGTGHREGTSTLDPRLARLTTTTAMPTGDLDSDLLSTLPARDRSLASLGSTLPLRTKGNGLAVGIGHDPIRGRASGSRPPATPAPDYQIVSLRQVKVFHRLRIGESADPSEPIRVRILVGADGVPVEATVVSGPDFLREAAIAAARQWRFDPPGRHGLTAPVAVVLNFFPVFTS